jgi:hypothetical protein
MINNDNICLQRHQQATMYMESRFTILDSNKSLLTHRSNFENDKDNTKLLSYSIQNLSHLVMKKPLVIDWRFASVAE